MIFEILIAICVLVAIIMAIYQYRQYHEVDDLILPATFCICVIIFLFGVLAGGFAEAFVNTNSIEPIKKVKLETINGDYIVNDNSSYYFKYDGTLHHSKSCFIFSMDESDNSQPTVYICRLKYSFWVSELYGRGTSFYVFLIPSDDINYQNNIPEWVKEASQ